MEIICSLRFKKFKQSVNKNTSSVCIYKYIYLEREFINTKQASFKYFFRSSGPSLTFSTFCLHWYHSVACNTSCSMEKLISNGTTTRKSIACCSQVFEL